MLITFKFRCDNTLNIRGHNSDLSPLHNRCIHLLKKPCLAGLWRECFHDNLFTSIKLALYALYEAQIKCTGVMRSGRGFPVEALEEVETNRMDPQEKKENQIHSGRSFGLKLHDGVTKFGFLAICVHDTKPVKFLSTSIDAVSVRQKIRRIAEKIDGAYTGEFVNHSYSVLSLIAEYNLFMGGVDLQDRLRWYYRVNGKHMWRINKWTWALYLWVIETRCVNAFIAHKILVNEAIEEYEKLITVEFERLKDVEARRRLRNGQTSIAEEKLEARAKVNVRKKKGPKPQALSHLDFQLSVARSKLGLTQVHESLLEKTIDVKKKRKATESLKHMALKMTHQPKPKNPVKRIARSAKGAGLDENRPLQFHAIRSRGKNDTKKDRKCQICNLQGPKFWGQSKKKLIAMAGRIAPEPSSIA